MLFRSERHNHHRRGFLSMSHLTDDARRRGAKTHITVPGQSLEEIVAANPDRRRLLKNGLLGLSILPFAGVLSACDDDEASRSEEHTSELQSLMRISYAVLCLKKKN